MPTGDPSFLVLGYGCAWHLCVHLDFIDMASYRQPPITLSRILKSAAIDSSRFFTGKAGHSNHVA